MQEEDKKEEAEPVERVSVQQFMKNVCSKADLVFCLTVKGKSLSPPPPNALCVQASSSCPTGASAP